MGFRALGKPTGSPHDQARSAGADGIGMLRALLDDAIRKTAIAVTKRGEVSQTDSAEFIKNQVGRLNGSDALIELCSHARKAEAEMDRIADSVNSSLSIEQRLQMCAIVGKINIAQNTESEGDICREFGCFILHFSTRLRTILIAGFNPIGVVSARDAIERVSAEMKNPIPYISCMRVSYTAFKESIRRE